MRLGLQWRPAAGTCCPPWTCTGGATGAIARYCTWPAGNTGRTRSRGPDYHFLIAPLPPVSRFPCPLGRPALEFPEHSRTRRDRAITPRHAIRCTLYEVACPGRPALPHGSSASGNLRTLWSPPRAWASKKTRPSPTSDPSAALLQPNSPASSHSSPLNCSRLLSLLPRRLFPSPLSAFSRPECPCLPTRSFTRHALSSITSSGGVLVPEPLTPDDTPSPPPRLHPSTSQPDPPRTSTPGAGPSYRVRERNL